MWRIQLAKHLVGQLKKTKNLVAVFIGGSVCRGFSDDYSDIEICFVWHQHISDEERRCLNKTLGFDSHQVTRSSNDINDIEENVRFKNIPIDNFHTTVRKIDQTIHSVVVD